MISELLPGLTLMVLLGLISGRSTATRLLAFSKLSLKMCVTTCPAGAVAGAGGVPTGLGTSVTPPPCNLASASGTTLYRPLLTTMLKPCSRRVAKNWSQATAGDTGFSVLRLMLPLTRGSTTRLRPVKPARVRATASMSALTKLSTMGWPGLAVCAQPVLARAQHRAKARVWEVKGFMRISLF